MTLSTTMNYAGGAAFATIILALAAILVGLFILARRHGGQLRPAGGRRHDRRGFRASGGPGAKPD